MVKVILTVDWSHVVQFKLLLMAHDVSLGSGRHTTTCLT